MISVVWKHHAEHRHTQKPQYEGLETEAYSTLQLCIYKALPIWTHGNCDILARMLVSSLQSSPESHLCCTRGLTQWRSTSSAGSREILEDSYVSIDHDFTAWGKHGRRLSYPLQLLLFTSLGWARICTLGHLTHIPTHWLGDLEGLLWVSRCSFLSDSWKSEVMTLGSHVPCGKEVSQRLTHPQTGYTQSHTITHNLTCACTHAHTQPGHTHVRIWRELRPLR